MVDISQERMYELRHFCKQYREWVRAYTSIPTEQEGKVDDKAILRIRLKQKMQMVEQACIRTDPDVAPYIFMGVVDGLSYDQMSARNVLPCSRRTYYKLVKLFFVYLDKMRG